jgi:hypothetical protein
MQEINTSITSNSIHLDGYKPGQESLKFFNWNNMMFSSDTHNTPLAHFKLIDELTTKHTKFVGECFRGFAKTTLMSHKMPLYVAMLGRFPNFGPVKNAVLISDSYDQAAQQLKSCMSYYIGSEKLQSFLDVEKEKEGEIIFNNMKGHRMRICSKGSGQAFRGTNWEGQRPQWIIGDDLQEDGILYNPKLAEDLKSWWVGTVIQAVDISRYKVTVIGTPMIETDLINSLMASPEYNKVKFPVADEFTTDPKKMVSLWEDRFTPERIISMYKDAKALGKEGDFFREMFLEMTNEDTQIFKKEWFKKFKKKELMLNKKKYNFFTSMDLAVSKRESSDRSVVMTIAVNGDGHIFVVDIACGRFNPSEVIDHLFRQVRAYRPIEVRAEKAALQQVLNHFIDAKMLKENTHFLLNPLVYNSTTKKEVRIIGLQPKFKARMIHFPEDACHDEVMLLEKELLGQTRESNTTGHDDLCDTLANFLDDGFIFGGSDYIEEENVDFRFEVKDPTVF